MERIQLSDIGWIIVGLAIYLFVTSGYPGMIVRWVGALLGRRSARRAAPQPFVPLPTRRLMSRRYARTTPEPEPLRSPEIPLPNGTEPLVIGSQNRIELVLNAEEIAAVARMVDHNRTAAKPSKTSTIQAGFGLSRGGGPRYTRAALIYDALFGSPAPAVQYRELSPEQEAVRAQLRLKQKGATLN